MAWNVLGARVCGVIWGVGLAATVLGADGTNEVPFHQDKPPGPALTAAEAMAKMQLPPGFKIECVAQEPEVVNPTSFTFDDRGRIWVTESFEYPRASAGKGQDRIKILESTRHDGHFDKVTVFKEGLNIPCGIAIGNGGVYITNSPDVLFLQDTDGDGKADTQQVILTGFGRSDRHELPNSLTWGPDGWLYGMNGVYNDSRISFGGKNYDFTCGVWRYNPVYKKFELFAQGTSNPWGLDYNRQGDWFISCCVIDHLFHITQSGYYQRQGGPYPPQTHWLPSITTQRHQAAAYAGICYYDADNFPDEYRGTLLMGNLHGSAINRDTLTRQGATYVQHNAPDFAQANDAWFMPVSQKIGPDGCLYVIDWYDKYHCYQDANRDPKGVDRERGRIYRISYGDAPHPPAFDLQTTSTDELLKLLDHPNVWWRRTAQRVLNEKFQPTLVSALRKMALDTGDKNNGHMHALWLLVSQHAIDPDFQQKLLASADQPTRNWGVRAAGEMGEVPAAVFDRLQSLTRDPSPDVRVQVAIAAGRIRTPDPLPLLVASLDNADNAHDPLIPAIIYNNIKPMIPSRGQQIVELLEKDAAAQANFGETVVRWIHDATNALARTPRQIADAVARRLDEAAKNPRHDLAPDLEEAIDGFAATGVKPADRSMYFDQSIRDQLAKVAAARSGGARVPAAIMGLWWNDPAAAEQARRILADSGQPVYRRSAVLRALAERTDLANVAAFAAFVNDPTTPVLIRQEAVDALGAMDDASAAAVLLKAYPNLTPIDLRPMTINALVRSKAGATAVLDSLKAKQLAPADLNENQARRIIDLGDTQLTDRLTHEWGTVRTDRDPQRAELVDRYKKLILSRTAGSPQAGMKVFAAKCMQCHTIYGKGGSVGPDLTGVGRDNLDLVLSNVLDPNLVVGKPYYQWVVRLKNGTIVTGLLAEESDQRIVLRDGTQQIAVTRADIDRMKETTLSMMPEGLEKTMSEQEFVDLVAFLLTRSAPQPWE